MISLALIWLLTSAASYPQPMGDIYLHQMGATCDGQADDTDAFIRAINLSNELRSKGRPATIHIPTGICRIVGHLPSFTRGGVIVGEGPLSTIVRVNPSYEGDVFSWIDAWHGNALPFHGNSATPQIVRSGASVRGISVIGDRAASSLQNAFVFYDRADEVLMENVDVSYIKGRGLYSGVSRETGQGYMRESHFRGIRFRSVGSAGVPVVEFTSTGNADATNEIHLTEIDIYAPYGPGFVIRNANPRTPIAGIHVTELRVEGMEGSPADISSDLVDIGDPAFQGAIHDVTFSQMSLLDPYAGYSAFKISSANAMTQPYAISVDGSIGGGAPFGNGLNIQAGRNLRFRMSDIHTTGANIIVGSAPSVGGNITIDGAGRTDKWSWVVHPSSTAAIRTR